MKKENSRTSCWIVGAMLLALGSGVAFGDDAQTEKSGFRKFMEQDYLFGDWGGLRTTLREKHGVDFEFMYAGSVPMSLDGGLKHGSVYEGAALMLMQVDTGKAGLWDNGTFRASSLWLHSGAAFSPNYVGDLNQVSLLDFPDSLRLWELWYEHKFLDGKVSLKAGEMDIGMDFITPQYYNQLGSVSFLNQTFFYPTMAFNVYDQPGFPVGHHGLASTPYAAPGARLRVDATDQFYGQAGVYGGNPDRKSPGTSFRLSSDEGALAYFEVGWKHNQRTNDAGPPGNLKLGAWYHTDTFYDMHDGAFVAFDNALLSMGQPRLSDTLAYFGAPVPTAFTNPRTHEGNWGVYFLADHYLWREVGKVDPAQQGLIGFFRAAYAPPDRNLAQFGIDGGLVYKGLIPTRDWDTFGVAFSYLEISDDLRQAQNDLRGILDSLQPGAGAAIPHADYEAVLEMNYKLQLSAWCAVNTSAQRVFHPGGRIGADIPDAWVLIVQTTLRF